MSDAYYFVQSYLMTTHLEPVIKRNLVQYDEKGHQMYKMIWMDYELFQELFREGMEYMLSKSQDLTLENIDKYNLK